MDAILARGLALIRGLAVGALAITGCLVIQCQIVVFIALSKLQIELVLLQARLLRWIYFQDDFQHTNDGSLTNQSTSTQAEASRPPPPPLQVKTLPQVKLPPQTHYPEPSSMKSTHPKTNLSASTPEWQTKSVKEQKPGNGRRYAVKQVDTFLSVTPQQNRVNRPTQTLMTIAPPLKVASNGTSQIPDTFLPTFPAASHTISTTALNTWPVVASLPVNTAEHVLPRASNSAQARPLESHGDVSTSLCDQGRPIPSMKFAKRSLIKKVVEPSQAGVVPERTKIIRDTCAEVLAQDNISATSGQYSGLHNDVEPVPLGHLLPNFKESTVLKNSWCQQQQPINQLPDLPFGPEETARDALLAAYHGRESARMMLNMSYSPEHALAFDASAKHYNAKRNDLAAVMPSGKLSFADEEAFPYLSTKDTLEPDIAAAVKDQPDQQSPPPSPLTNNADSDAYSTPFKDPGPMITKASRAYQVLLQATKNTTQECMACNSKFCENAYSAAGKPKLKAAKDFYQKTRSLLVEKYGADAIPEWLEQQLPTITEC